MKNGDETFWTIDELGERVAEALGGPGYDGVPSGRVRDVPDLRTIRYYTTLGLLDRPAAMRGRTALYGPRHLLQLVAIKRLQARGLSLAAVQERVVGLSDAALRRLAAAEAAASTADCSSDPGVASRRNRSGASSQNRTQSRPAKKARACKTSRWRHGLVLSLAAGRALDEDDLRVIRMAAAPLIEILRLRGLIGIGPSTTNERRRAMTMTRSRPLPLLDEVAPLSIPTSRRARRRLRRARDGPRPPAAGGAGCRRAGSTACYRR